jgi:hypothetical protein
MPHIDDTHATACRLASLLDGLSAGCDPDFDAASDDLEREFAEIRLRLGSSSRNHHG